MRNANHLCFGLTEETLRSQFSESISHLASSDEDNLGNQMSFFIFRRISGNHINQFFAIPQFDMIVMSQGYCLRCKIAT